MVGEPEKSTEIPPDKLALDGSGWIRRTDVALRTQYPNLITRIFELAPNQYLIVFDKSLQDSSLIDIDEIRPITLWVKLSNEMPRSYSREIQTLPDVDLAHNFEGFPFTNAQLFNLIAGRFPDLPIVALNDGGTPMTVTVELARAVEPQQAQHLLSFCNGLGVPAPFRLKITEQPESSIAGSPAQPASKIQSAEDMLLIRASKFRSGAPSFVRADEAFWFDNLDKIYAGGLGVEQMPGIEEGQSRCFVEATIGEHVNLRQLLTLYDTVYLSPPLLEGYDAFLAKQALSEDDLLNLVERGRLKFIGTQAEERLNTQLLTAAAERCASAIIGRRATAALLIADFVRTAERYRLRDEEHYAAIGEASRILGEQSGLTANQILTFLLWPVQVRRAAVWPLLDRGSKGVAPIGIGPFAATFVERMVKKDLELECLMVSEKIHIGHALDATVFPMREEPEGLHALANLMGEALNFFRSFNTEIAASWAENVARREAGKRLLPPIPLFEFDAKIPIGEILAATDRPSMRNRGRALFNRIADMTEQERAAEVERLNLDLRQYGRPSGIISFDNLDTGIGAASIILGFPFPPVAGLAKFASQLAELVRKHPEIDRLFERVQADLFVGGEKRRELDFLSKISRVASLKTSKVS